MSIKLLFIAGSARAESFNKKLAKYAAGIANQDGVDAQFIDLKDFPMPIYDGDWEEENGLPENAVKLKKIFIECDGFFIASPEYNSSFSPLLKNTIDWMSRSGGADEKPLVAYKGKVAAIAGVSPGALGGLRGLVPLRMLLSNIGVHVIPTQAAIGNGTNAFGADGQLTGDAQIKMMDNLIKEFIETTKSITS